MLCFIPSFEIVLALLLRSEILVENPMSKLSVVLICKVHNRNVWEGVHLQVGYFYKLK